MANAMVFHHLLLLYASSQLTSHQIQIWEPKTSSPADYLCARVENIHKAVEYAPLFKKITEGNI
jgi:hypothetical protein